jgi:hypothetical protein
MGLEQTARSFRTSARRIRSEIWLAVPRLKPFRVRRVPYREHVPPDVTACIFWLKNRDPAHWRDAWRLDHTLGKYIISDQPMSEEQWIRERATTIDVTPEK